MKRRNDGKFDEPPNKKFDIRNFSGDDDTEDEGKERSPMSLFKMQIHDTFLKVIDHAVGDFAISGQLQNAPIVVISLKVLLRFITISSDIQKLIILKSREK